MMSTATYTQVQYLDQVELNRLQPFDTLLIQTEHHIYSFTVSDPSMAMGTLYGGFLGEKAARRTLIVATTEEPNSEFNNSMISIGNSIVFFIQSGIELLRIKTSLVTNLFRLTQQAYLAEI